MNFEGDAFISYAHMDDVELIEGRKAWVANLHRALAVRVGQLLVEPPQIWRDPKLQGNDFFAETLVGRLRHVASLISVVSPRYVRSEWARKELTEFWNAAEQQGGVRFRDRARIFKVLKTPVPLEVHPPELQSLLGYEFFKVDADTGKVRELDGVGPSYQLYRGEHVRVGPVVEFVGWSVRGGFETVWLWATTIGIPATGNNVANLKIGVRTSLGGGNSPYFRIRTSVGRRGLARRFGQG